MFYSEVGVFRMCAECSEPATVSRAGEWARHHDKLCSTEYFLNLVTRFLLLEEEEDTQTRLNLPLLFITVAMVKPYTMALNQWSTDNISYSAFWKKE